MPLNSIASITTIIGPVASNRPGFGIAALFTPVTSAQETAFGADYGKTVTRDTYVSVLEGLGFTSSDDIWIACVDHFSQDLVPDYAIVARRATKVAQVNTYTVGGTTDGTYTITLDGADASFAASGNTETEIRDGLIAAIGALPLASYYTTATVSTDALTVTAANAGLGFTSSVDSPGDVLTQVATTANEGLPEDIVDLLSQRTDFYAIMEVSHDDNDALAGARYVETLQKFAMWQSNAANIVTNATTDVLSIMQDEALIRSAVVYNTNDDQFIDGAWLGRLLPTDVGSNNWAYKQLRSVVGDEIDTTEELNLIAKNGNWYELFSALGNSSTRQGITPGGQYIDIIRGRDWLDANLQIDIYDAQRANEKIAYTNEGLQILGAVVRGRLEDAADQGLIDRSTIVVNVPTRAQQSASDISRRHVDNITWSATLTGAVNSVEVTGTLVAA